jgi:NAD(P)-dependent dehydrogenase (short-subunit alcohol dehydrogenase family)
MTAGRSDNDPTGPCASRNNLPNSLARPERADYFLPRAVARLTRVAALLASASFSKPNSAEYLRPLTVPRQHVFPGFFEETTDEQWANSIKSKGMGQINLVRAALPFITDKGSFTLVSGVLTDEYMHGGTIGTTINHRAHPHAAQGRGGWT